MATSAAQKTLTAGELRKLQERAGKAQEQAQEQADALFLAQQATLERREAAALKERLQSAREDVAQHSVAELVQEFGAAAEEYAHNKGILEAAKLGQDRAMVVMARVAFKTAIHPEVAGNKAQNINGAASALGMPYSTLRPYVLAGGALFREDRAFLLSTPDADDIAIVSDSFDANSRKAQIDKRKRAAIKAAEAEAARAAAEAEAARLREALQQAQQQQQQQNGQEQAPEAGAQQQQQAGAEAAQDGQQEQQQAAQAPAQAPAQQAAQQAPAQAQQEQAQAPAQDGDSVTAGILKLARELAKQASALRKMDSKAWQAIRPEVQAQLAELFPQELGKGKGK